MSFSMYSDYVKDNCFSKNASFLWLQVWKANSKFISGGSFRVLPWDKFSSDAKRRIVQSRLHTTSECSGFPVENTEHDSLVVDVTVQIWRECDAELQGLYALVWRSVICDVKQKQSFSVRYEIRTVQLPDWHKIRWSILMSCCLLQQKVEENRRFHQQANGDHILTAQMEFPWQVFLLLSLSSAH